MGRPDGRSLASGWAGGRRRDTPPPTPAPGPGSSGGARTCQHAGTTRRHPQKKEPHSGLWPKSQFLRKHVADETTHLRNPNSGGPGCFPPPPDPEGAWTPVRPVEEDGRPLTRRRSPRRPAGALLRAQTFGLCPRPCGAVPQSPASSDGMRPPRGAETGAGAGVRGAAAGRRA